MTTAESSSTQKKINYNDQEDLSVKPDPMEYIY